MDGSSREVEAPSSSTAILSAAFSLSQSDAPLALLPAQSAIHDALSALSSGLLAAHSPDDVEPTVAALLPLLCDPFLSSKIAWSTALSCPDDSSSLTQGIVDFFAARTAANLSSNLDLLGGSSASAVYVGILGEATRGLRAIDVVLEQSFALSSVAPFHLPDRVLSDIVFSSFRVRASGDLADDGVGMVAALGAVRSEARSVATALLERLPAYAKRTRTLSHLILRVWRTDAPRDGLHRHLAAGLRKEAVHLCSEDALLKLSLASVPTVVRRLVEGIEDSQVNTVLSQIIAVVLPIVGDAEMPRRMHAIAVIQRCVDVCEAPAFAMHSPVVVSALTEALGFDDWLTAVEAFPPLAKAMRMVYPVVVVQSEPPGVWKEALKEALRAFVSLLEKCQDAERSGENVWRSSLLAVAAVARHLPEVAGVRLVLKMDAVVTAFGEALVLAGLSVSRDGRASLPIFIAIKNAFVKVIQHTWPRVPGHFGTIIGAAFRAVMVARVTADSTVLSEVTVETSDLLYYTALCGELSSFTAVLDGVRETLEEHDSLSAGLALYRATMRRISELKEESASNGESFSQEQFSFEVERRFDALSLQ